MPNYHDGKIYAIRCLTTGKQYIGSTTAKTLAKRLAEHKCAHTRHIKNLANKTASFEIIEQGNYRMELIELCPCNSKDELHAREGHFIRTIDCANKVVAGRSQQEYRQTHKEEITKYLQDNKEKTHVLG